MRDFVDVPVAFEVVAPRMIHDPGWLSGIAGHALGDALTTLPRLAGSGPDDRVNVADCVAGVLQRRGASLVLPLRWSSDTPAAGIRWLDGDLRFSPGPGGHSRLTLLALCPSDGPPAPPSDAVESGVRCFLEALAALITSTSP